MKVAKWGNSLAIRLPVDLVKSMDLKEGDEIELDPRGSSIDVYRKLTDNELLEKIRRMRRAFPADYKFDRDEANER